MKKIAAGYEKDEDQIDNQEDAPLVAGVVDDRSVEMITKQDFVESSKWKRLGADVKDKLESKSKSSDGRDVDSSRSHQPRKDSTALKKSITVKKERVDPDSDPSPPRKRHDSDSDASPPRRKRHDSDSDQSPLRRRKGSDSDQSPPRKHKKADDDFSPPRRKKNVDSSAQRGVKQDSDGDLSPERPNKSTSRFLWAPDSRQRTFSSSLR